MLTEDGQNIRLADCYSGVGCDLPLRFIRFLYKYDLYVYTSTGFELHQDVTTLKTYLAVLLCSLYRECEHGIIDDIVNCYLFQVAHIRKRLSQYFYDFSFSISNLQPEDVGIPIMYHCSVITIIITPLQHIYRLLYGCRKFLYIRFSYEYETI